MSPLDVIEGRAQWCVICGDMVVLAHDPAQSKAQRDHRVPAMRQVADTVRAPISAGAVLLQELCGPLDGREPKVAREIRGGSSRMEGRPSIEADRANPRASRIPKCAALRGLRQGERRTASSRREHSQQRAREHRVRLSQMPLRATPEGPPGIGTQDPSCRDSRAMEGS